MSKKQKQQTKPVPAPRKEHARRTLRTQLLKMILKNESKRKPGRPG